MPTVKYPTGGLFRGIYPREIANPSNHLTGADFLGGPQNEVEPDHLVGEYIGSAPIADYGMTLYVMPSPAQSYQTVMTTGEFILLFPRPVYRTLYKEAYPQGAQAGDDEVLIFFEAAKSGSGEVDLADPRYITAMAYFVAQGYMTQQEADTVMLGIPL